VQAMRRVNDLNSTVFSVIPTQAQLDGYKACAVEVFNVTDIQASILVDLKALNATVKGLPSFVVFSSLLGGFQSSINMIPNLPLLDYQLRLFNTSMTNTNLGSVQSQLIALNTSMSSFQQLPSLSTDLTNFKANILSIPVTPLAK
jgi:hypothetical protein